VERPGDTAVQGRIGVALFQLVGLGRKPERAKAFYATLTPQHMCGAHDAQKLARAKRALGAASAASKRVIDATSLM
jgi:hypothetical protein